MKHLATLPSATIITAQIDPLRSEGEALAKRLNSTIAAALLGLAICNSAYSQPESKEVTEEANAPMMKKDHLMMKKGKMIVTKDGKATMMEKEMTLSDGTKVMKDGTCMMMDGKKMMMSEGDMIMMNGKMMKAEKMPAALKAKKQ